MTEIIALNQKEYSIKHRRYMVATNENQIEEEHLQEDNSKQP